MKNFSLIIRRTHLYLTLLCLPWFVMYAVTAIAFHHADWFEEPKDLYNTSGDSWTRQGSWPCNIEVPQEPRIPREYAAELLKVAGIESDAFGAYRSGSKRIEVYFLSFWDTRRLTYQLDQQQLVLFTRQSTPSMILSSMHARAGYHQDGFWNNAWAVMVDATCTGMLIWVATGLFIWWQVPRMRGWGIFALAAGFASFALFMYTL